MNLALRVGGLALALVATARPVPSADSTASADAFRASEAQRSTIPLRPGVPGKSPFWNTFARRFIYAPAFDYRTVPGAVKYGFEVVSLKDLDNAAKLLAEFCVSVTSDANWVP